MKAVSLNLDFGPDDLSYIIFFSIDLPLLFQARKFAQLVYDHILSQKITLQKKTYTFAQVLGHKVQLEKDVSDISLNYTQNKDKTQNTKNSDPNPEIEDAQDGCWKERFELENDWGQLHQQQSEERNPEAGDERPK